MNPLRVALTVLALSLCIASSAYIHSISAADEWKPIDPVELAAKTPAIDPSADAEGLFWEIRVDDEAGNQLVYKNYIRVKIFTDRGKETQSKIDLEYLNNVKIKDIAARTIKPDGTIIELKKDDIFDKTIVKVSGAKLKAKSFAMPSVEPGAIIEYRWKEVQDIAAGYIVLPFQRSIPVRSTTYLVKPFSEMGMGYQPFRIPKNAKFEKMKDGFFKLSVENMPAFQEEPRMPPEDTVRSWVLLYYTDDTSKSRDEFWVDYGRGMFDLVKDNMKVNDDVRREAARIVGDATDPQAKLQRLHEYCRTQIKNINYAAASGMSQQDREKFDTNRSPSDTLKKGIANGAHVDYLFAALATAAGFEARLALSGDRSSYFLDREFADPYFISNRGSRFIAVKVGEKWQFFSPAERYTPFGMLSWLEEGQSALIVQKDPIWVDVPLSAPEKSLKKRTGKLRLLEDGTLEGDIAVEYYGQFDIAEKTSNDDESPEAREKDLIDSLKERISNIEVTNVKIENAMDAIKPYTYSYHFKASGYAQKTGKRLFFQPGFFVYGTGPMFKSATRIHPVFFRYPWSEEDHLTIELPPGFDLDNADAPAPLTPAETQNICAHEIIMGVNTSERTLKYDRKFFFGGQGRITFSQTQYAAIKQLFDEVSKGDEHTITLRQNVVSSN